MRLAFAMPAFTALLALTACGGTGANGGSGDNHPEVCAEQNAMAKAGLVDGRQQSIACPDHGIGPRLGQGNALVVTGVPVTTVATTAPSRNEYNDNAAIYRGVFDGLVSTLPQN